MDKKIQCFFLKVIFFILLLASISCNSTQNGYELIDDLDGDRIPTYDDVDEISLSAPANGAIIFDVTPNLIIYQFNPEIVQRYYIQISSSLNDFDNNVLFENDNIPSNVYTVPNVILENNKKYFWRAKAHDGTKWSDNWSPTWSFTVDIGTVQLISPINSIFISDITPTFTWENIDNAQAYRIVVSSDQNFTSDIKIDEIVYINSYTPIDRNLLKSINSISYSWNVEYQNEDGVWSEYSFSDFILGKTWYHWFLDSLDDVGLYTSIKLDTNGLHHISYYDNTNGDLNYLYFDGNNWYFQTVDSIGNVGQYTSIDIDINNYPHISYADRTNYTLKYAYFNGVNWIIQIVDNNVNIGWNIRTSISLDSNNYPHISYYDGNIESVKYAFFDGTDWNIEIIGTGSSNSIAVDGNDHPFIAYKDQDNSKLKCAHFNGSSWNIDIITSGGSSCSLVLDNNDYPHISHYNRAYGWDYHNELKYSFFNGNNWTTQIIDDGEAGMRSYIMGLYSSIDLDTEGDPHIYHYFEKYNVAGWTTVGDLIHTYRANKEWYGIVSKMSVTIDENDGLYCSLSIGNYDDMGISYYDWTNGNLRYSYYGWE